MDFSLDANANIVLIINGQEVNLVDENGRRATINNTSHIFVDGQGGSDTIDLSYLTGYQGTSRLEGRDGIAGIDQDITGSPGRDTIIGGAHDDNLYDASLPRARGAGVG